jgi:hypothetical protein
MRSRWVALSCLLLVALVLLRVASVPPWPDDWDGIGFVESIGRFDLDHFAPHPPGYPVYVVLLRAAGLVIQGPVAAANAVAVVSGLAATALLGFAGLRAFGSGRAAGWLLAFTALTPLAWRACTAIGSEAPALAVAGAGLVSATMAGRARAWGIGAAIGLGLGVRLSWAPLYLAFLFLAAPGERRKAALVAVVAALSWAVPFVALVGPTHLARLAMTHAGGHFERWGGTTLTEPGASRLPYLARDVFVDGLGVDSDPLGIAIGALGLGLLALGGVAWRRRGWPHARLGFLLLPYLLWIALGQNLRAQPRHALPLVIALAGALAVAATSSRRAGALGGVLLGLIALRTASDAWARRTIPPPGAQLVAFVSALPGPPSVAVFAGPSARFFELSRSNVARTVGTLGDARLAVGRLPSLPARLIVTSELQGLDPSREPLVSLATLCRPARIDRRAPCLEVYDWRAPFLAPR